MLCSILSLYTVSVTDGAVLVGWCVRPKFLLALRRTQLQEEEEFLFCSDAFLVWLAGGSFSRSNLVGIKTNRIESRRQASSRYKKYTSWYRAVVGSARRLPSTLFPIVQMCLHAWSADRSWKRETSRKQKVSDQERLFPSEVSRAVPGAVQYKCRLIIIRLKFLQLGIPTRTSLVAELVGQISKNGRSKWWVA